jgi:hypothetical protein
MFNLLRGEPGRRATGKLLTRDKARRIERSKAEAHQVALRWRAQGLPLAIAMPNGVVGANDHSFGYLLRLTLLGAMLPVGFGGDPF